MIKSFLSLIITRKFEKKIEACYFLNWFSSCQFNIVETVCRFLVFAISIRYDGRHVRSKLCYSKCIRRAVLRHNALIGGAKTRVSKYPGSCIVRTPLQANNYGQATPTTRECSLIVEGICTMVKETMSGIQFQGMNR